MKLLLILLLFPIILHAQVIEPGLYVKATLNYDDGSVGAAPSSSAVQFLKYRFLPNGRVQVGADVLFYMTETDYSIKDSVLTVGFVKYKIDALSPNVLVIHQINQNTDNPSFSFLRPGNLIASDKPQFNTVIRDSVYSATRYIFPDCDLSQSDFVSSIPFDSPGEFTISLIVDKLGNIADINVEGGTEKEKKNAAAVSKMLRSKKMKWLPAMVAGQNVNSSLKLIYKYSTGGNSHTVTRTWSLQVLFQ